MPNDRARELRQNPTDAEVRLWTVLRRRQMLGCQFRRQAPIGRYIVDFVCFARRLIIEVDGGQHTTDMARDAVRTAWLESQGFQILRFWNHDVLANLDGVADTIRRKLVD